MTQTAPRSVRVGVVIPALDEEAALPLVLQELARVQTSGSGAGSQASAIACVVVCDNGSRDRTAQVAREHGALVVVEPRRGYGSACLAALAVLLDAQHSARSAHVAAFAPHDVIVFLDADHSDHAEELPLVVAPILADRADFVVGARRADAQSRAALTPQQRGGNALACLLMRVLFGARHTDLGPFRAIRVDALRHLGMRDRDYGWTVEMQLKARVARLRVEEVPVRYRQRIGVSKISGTLRGVVLAGWKILGWITAWRLALWFGPGPGPFVRR